MSASFPSQRSSCHFQPTTTLAACRSKEETLLWLPFCYTNHTGWALSAKPCDGRRHWGKSSPVGEEEVLAGSRFNIYNDHLSRQLTSTLSISHQGPKHLQVKHQAWPRQGP